MKNINKITIIKIILYLIVTILLVVTLSGCSSLDSSMKDLESEFGNGLNRVVKIYSQNGELLGTYEGKINIEYDEDRVLFQVDRGKRIGVYSKTATVVVEEK